MSGSIDFRTIARVALQYAPLLLSEWFPRGKFVGNEFQVGNLSGKRGKSLRINIKTGVWCDFAADEHRGGDLISLRAAMTGVSQAEAARELATHFGLDVSEPTPNASGGTNEGDPEEWIPALPPNERPSSSLSHPMLGTPDHVFAYRTDEGALAFFVCRWDETRDRKKEFRPRSWGKFRGKDGWQWKSWRDGRPIYRLPQLLAASPETPVVVVEGELTADALAEAVGEGWAVVSWSGGSKTAYLTDWSPLKGRTVLIWPDCDKSGSRAAGAVARSAVIAEAKFTTIMPPPRRTFSGWDAHDAIREGWTGEQLEKVLQAELEKETFGAPPPPDRHDPAEINPAEDCPFEPLGRKGGTYYVLAIGGEILDLVGSRMTPGALETLVDGDMAWFYRHFSKANAKGEEELNFVAARRWIMQACGAKGLHDPATPIRGTGVWRDSENHDRLIIHCGDAVRVDGTWVRPGFRRGNEIYTAFPAIKRPAAQPADCALAHELYKALQRWSYVNPAALDLLFGFVGQAFLGGAPPWHAHVFIKAQSGSGKTTLARLIAAALGGMAHPIKNNYTEAHLRQAMTAQARTMILDEAERDDTTGHRIAAVIELIRNMSGAEGAHIGRGSASGESRGFQLTGPAYLSSVLQGYLKPQDRSRITTIELKRLSDDARMGTAAADLEALIREIAEISPALRARAVAGWDRFRHNLSAWRSAFLKAGCEPREADQLGTLLAGRDMLLYDTPTDPAALETSEVLARFGAWIGAGREDEHEGEGRECLDHLLGSQPDLWRSGERPTVARILLMAMKNDGDTQRQMLQSIGLRLDHWKDPDNTVLYVANRHPGLKKIYDGTRWKDYAWKDALRYLPGVTACPGNQVPHFDGVQSRASVVPARYLPSEAEAETSEADQNLLIPDPSRNEQA